MLRFTTTSCCFASRQEKVASSPCTLRRPASIVRHGVRTFLGVILSLPLTPDINKYFPLPCYLWSVHAGLNCEICEVIKVNWAILQSIHLEDQFLWNTLPVAFNNTGKGVANIYWYPVSVFGIRGHDFFCRFPHTGL